MLHYSIQYGDAAMNPLLDPSKPKTKKQSVLILGVGCGCLILILLLFLVVVTIQDILVPLPQGFNWSDYLY